MADVFLSYGRGDRVVAERLADAIGKSGLTVWWDRHIKGGAEFSRDIENQLNAASKVLVLWSVEAVNSRWVRDEATVAADSGRLVSATLDGTPPPLGFRQFQTIDLKKWAAKGAAIPPNLAEALEIETPVAGTPRPSRSPRWLFVVGVAALVLAGATTVAITRPDSFVRWFSNDKQSEQLSLAIMPFATSGDAKTNYLGVGLPIAIADSLAPLPGLKLTASTSTQALAGKGMTAPEIAAKLGISHLVEGSVQQSGSRYTISVRLIAAKTSEQIWTRTFEGGLDELQALKTRMARELAGALSARLGVGQGKVADRRNVEPRAYEAYLRALEQVSVRDDKEARLEAIKQFRLAGSIQPEFADAHAGYAYLLALSIPQQLDLSWNEIIAQQRSATDLALRVDPDNDLALVAKAAALQNFDGDVAGSMAVLQPVLKRSPNLGAAHYVMASALLMAGQGRQALDHLDQAIDRDPFDMSLQSYRLRIFYSLGDYEAIRALTAKCSQDCGSINFQWLVAMVGLATPQQYRDDYPLIAGRLTAQGSPASFLATSRQIADALILGKTLTLPKLQTEEGMDFTNAVIGARFISFEEGIRYAGVAAEQSQADAVIDILNDGRVTFSREQRADTRYHQLFRHPKLVGILAARRKAGVNAGLPVFPVKPYTNP